MPKGKVLRSRFVRGREGRKFFVWVETPNGKVRLTFWGAQASRMYHYRKEGKLSYIRFGE